VERGTLAEMGEGGVGRTKTCLGDARRVIGRRMGGDAAGGERKRGSLDSVLRLLEQ